MTTTVSAPATEERADAPHRLGGRLLDAADLLAFAALLNALVLIGTLAGGIVLGVAPSLAAAATCSRHRLLGNGGSTIRLFFSVWRTQFLRANIVQAPAALALGLLLINASALWGASPAIAIPCVVIAAFVFIIQLIATVLDAQYDVARRSVLLLAARFALQAPGAPLLLAASVALVGAVTAFIPGLLPVISVGAGIYLATALCLSFFAANDERVAAHQPLVEDDE